MDKFNPGQIMLVPIDTFAEDHNIAIAKDTNKYVNDHFQLIGEQLKIRIQEAREKGEGVSEANQALAYYDQLKKFLMDRSMLKSSKAGVWEGTPCLLDNNKNEVHFKNNTVVIRDKWSR